MTRPIICRLLAVLLFVFSATAAGAASLSIGAFTGKWQGSAVSESDISVHFRLTSRDIDVDIRPVGDGFTIAWATVQRQKGDPSNPTEELKATTLKFVSAGNGLWRGEANNDPLSSGVPYYWAYIDQQTLVIKGLRIYPDGRHETQIYRRTLSGTGMKLDFERIVDGEEVRRASGRLVKVAK